MLLESGAVEARIRQELATGFGFDRPLALDGSLRRAAVFDSANVIDFVMFLEESFGITVDSDDMVQDTFESIGSLVEFVIRKVQQARAAA